MLAADFQHEIFKDAFEQVRCCFRSTRQSPWHSERGNRHLASVQGLGKLLLWTTTPTPLNSRATCCRLLGVVLLAHCKKMVLKTILFPVSYFKIGNKRLLSSHSNAKKTTSPFNVRSRLGCFYAILRARTLPNLKKKI